MTYVRSLSRFDALAGVPVEESERYYTNVHIPFARRTLADMPSMVRYSTYRVESEYDIAGGWHRPPSTWRFVEIVRDADTPLPTAGEGPSWREAMGRDHANFLCNMRRYELTSSVLYERGVRHTALQAYWFEYFRPESADEAEAKQRFMALAADFASSSSGATGVQTVTRDDVVVEGKIVDLSQPRQLPVDGDESTITLVGYLRVHLDSA